MPNEWNKLLSGALQGGASLTQGFQQQSLNKDADMLYNKALQSLNSLFDKYNTVQPTQKQVEDQKLADISKLNVQTYDTEKIGSPAMVIKEPYTLSELYRKVNNARMNLISDYGDRGKLRADMLGDYLSQLLKSGERKIVETKDGIYSYSPTDASSFRLEVPFTKKEEKKPFTLGDYSKMTIDDILNLPDKEIAYGIPYFSESAKTKVFEMFPDLKREYDIKLRENEFAPKIPGSRSRYRGTGTNRQSPKDRDLYDDYIAIAKGDVEEEDVRKLADSMNIAPVELKRMANEVYEGKNFRQVQNELNEKIESIPGIMRDLGLDILADDLYNTETDLNKGGAIEDLYVKENNAMKIVNDNWDIIPESVRGMLLREIVTIFNKVRKSKGIADYEL